MTSNNNGSFRKSRPRNITRIPPSLASSPRSVQRRGPDLTDGSERLILKQRNAPHGTSFSSAGTNSSGGFPTAANTTSPSRARAPTPPPTSLTPTKKLAYHGGPVDLDESDLDLSSPEQDENTAKTRHQPRLSTERLEEFTSQHQQQQKQQPVFSMSADTTTNRAPVTRFSAGHVALAVDDSDGESSSFNLSTDAEDTEYEELRRRGVLRGHHQQQGQAANQSLDSSSISQVSSPTNYNTDGETSVFPNLNTDDEGTTTERESVTGSTALGPTDNDSEEAPSPTMKIVAIRNKTPEKKNESVSPAKRSSPTSPSSPNPTDDARAWGMTRANGAASNNKTASGGSNGFGPRRSFTSPKSSAATTSPSNGKHETAKAFPKDDFANFADFNNANFDQSWQTQEPSSSPRSSPSKKIFIEADKSSPLHRNQRSHSHRNSTSASAVVSDTSLSDLLAQAKSKRSSSRSARRSSSSANSAPAITAAFLRQHHNLKSSRSERFSDSRSQNGNGTSVTDIIKSLEADNYSRSSSRHRRSRDGDAHSTHSRGSARSAKERLRRRRETERRRNSRSPDYDSSDSTDDNDAESWLMDEVTGALGPRGIAADLESLSGRSNRSRSSGGGRSHKSHRSHRSHRSHSRHRRHKSSTSDASVDSHGSKRSHGSRRSRSSRYSHRSSRSYISQMSEQSRSVANDLLRLEMQLAMVNPSGGGGGGGGGSGDEPQPRSSRSSRRSRNGSSSSSRLSSGSGGTARRSRMTVMAPPGKLGIILANKADSRGTVVSGVRTSSVLAETISPGDRIVAIDGEDVSLMTVSEITTIMARKSEFERALTVLTTPRSPESAMASPRSSSDYRSYRS